MECPPGRHLISCIEDCVHRPPAGALHDFLWTSIQSLRGLWKSLRRKTFIQLSNHVFECCFGNVMLICSYRSSPYSKKLFVLCDFGQDGTSAKLNSFRLSKLSPCATCQRALTTLRMTAITARPLNRPPSRATFRLYQHLTSGSL